jgi:hypothetical protein
MNHRGVHNGFLTVSEGSIRTVRGPVRGQNAADAALAVPRAVLIWVGQLLWAQ